MDDAQLSDLVDFQSVLAAQSDVRVTASFGHDDFGGKVIGVPLGEGCQREGLRVAQCMRWLRRVRWRWRWW